MTGTADAKEFPTAITYKCTVESILPAIRRKQRTRVVLRQELPATATRVFVFSCSRPPNDAEGDFVAHGSWREPKKHFPARRRWKARQKYCRLRTAVHESRSLQESVAARRLDGSSCLHSRCGVDCSTHQNSAKTGKLLP